MRSGRGWRPTRPCRGPTRRRRSGPDGPRAAGDSRPAWSAATTTTWPPRARPSRVPGRRRGAARRALRLLGRHVPRDPRRGGAAGPDGSAVLSGWSNARTRDCVEQGYLLSCPSCRAGGRRGDFEAAYATTVEAAEIGERFGDADLVAWRCTTRGCIWLKQGRVEAGLGLLDEAMVAVTAGELSPIVTGLLYCGVIDGCQEVFELRRAREWTVALTRWCAGQPEMVASPAAASSTAPRSCSCTVRGRTRWKRRGGPASASRRCRIRWRLASRSTVRARSTACEANAAPPRRHTGRRAGYGREPQPGLALLRLAQGDADAAAAAIRRSMGEMTEPLKRAGFLPAYVEIMLAVGEHRGGAQRLPRARGDRGGLPERHAGCDGRPRPGRGRALADGDAWAALASLRHAGQVWRELEAPYEAARVRVLVGLACRALGDEDAAAMELERGRAVFGQLGAEPDLARLEKLVRSRRRDATG